MLTRISTIAMVAALAASCAAQDVKPAASAASAPAKVAAACDADNGGITLSPGFCATVFADNLGNVRHIAVSPEGVVYVNVWSGRYYAGQPVPQDGFLIALKDGDKDGKAETIKKFGETAAQGSTGGSGIGLYAGYVYAEANDKIVRYKLPAGEIIPAPGVKPEVVVSGLPTTGDHPMHPFIIDAKGLLFVDLGSATNSCQPKNRQAENPGASPCTELETRAGIWRYDANKLGQVFSPKERYATGLRNAEGISLDGAGRMFATQHGRDQLSQNWGKLYPDAARTVELPAEELVEVKAGGDYGWPECYYDGFQKKLVLAPEYGGDGGKAVGVCAQKLAPVAAFPSHWAPNDLKIYNAKAFPKPYQGGAFIAFHGSWNRAPAPQDGFNVVFQPLKDGKASGEYVVFADGFTGPNKARAMRRPMALAVAPDGALFITDDVKGRIWRVTYAGPADIAAIAPASKPAAVAAAAPVAAPSPIPSAPAQPTQPQAPAPAQVATLPAGVTAAQIAAGDRIYHGGTCIACHGGDAKGSAVGPDLTDATWLWGDGSPAAIAKVISEGVSSPKQYRSAMPAGGGQTLSATDLAALSAYVWSVSHPGAKDAVAPPRAK